MASVALSRTPASLAIVWLVLLAGCAGAAPTAAPDAERPVSDIVARFDSETGGIEGLVLDESQQPLEDAIIVLVGSGQTVVTGADGAFAFHLVRPGTVELLAQHETHQEVTRSLEVRAGEVSRIQFLLPDIPSDLPRIQHAFARGFWTCWLGVVFGSPLCSDLAGKDVYYGNVDIAAGHNGSVTEVVWQPGSAFTSPGQARVILFVFSSSDATAVQNGPVAGRSPARLEVRAGDWSTSNGRAWDLNATKIQWQARPGGNTANSADSLLTYQQHFTTYVSVFHNQPVMAGYSAIPDG